MILINLLILCNIIVFIIDISGVVDVIKKKLFKWLYPNKQYRYFTLKPFDCSLCLTFWLGLLYLILAHTLTFPYMLFVCLLAFMTPVFKSIWLLIQDFLIKIIEGIYTLFNL